MNNNIDINWDELGFNIINTKSMYFSKCKHDGNWSGGGLIPFGKIELSPAAGVLNYGQGVFEGTNLIEQRIIILFFFVQI